MKGESCVSSRVFTFVMLFNDPKTLQMTADILRSFNFIRKSNRRVKTNNSPQKKPLILLSIVKYSLQLSIGWTLTLKDNNISNQSSRTLCNQRVPHSHTSSPSRLHHRWPGALLLITLIYDLPAIGLLV